LSEFCQTFAVSAAKLELPPFTYFNRQCRCFKLNIFSVVHLSSIFDIVTKHDQKLGQHLVYLAIFITMFVFQ